MALSKYKFIAGEKWPAENASSIDPDNVVAQTPAQLIGGSGVSALTVFQALGAGADNGKIKINIDGVVYDNVAISLNENKQAEATKVSYAWDNNTQYITGISFTVTSGYYITKFNVNSSAYGNPALTWYLRRGEDVAGEVLATGSVGQHAIGSDQPISPNVWLEPGVYCFTFSTQFQPYYRSGSGSAGARNYNGSSWVNNQSALTVKGQSATPVTFDIIASKLQTAIRALTSKLETVIYSTDHFVFATQTIGRLASILKLMTPSAGTDLSGAGATPYLDCSGNATEVAGDGDEFRLVRLDENNLLPTEIINKDELFAINVGDVPLLSANTERNTNSTSYTKLKEITINKSGTYRVYFGLRRNSSSNTAYGRIYKNGVALGTQRSSTSSTVAYYSEDFAFVAGDKVQLYAYIDSASYQALVSSFQIRALLIPVSVGVVNTD